jgi:hypothetical protein
MRRRQARRAVDRAKLQAELDAALAFIDKIRPPIQIDDRTADALLQRVIDPAILTAAQTAYISAVLEREAKDWRSGRGAELVWLGECGLMLEQALDVFLPQWPIGWARTLALNSAPGRLWVR